MTPYTGWRCYAKAVLAALAAGIAFAIPVVDDGLAVSEVLGILSAVLVAGGVVWRVPNVVSEPT